MPRFWSFCLFIFVLLAGCASLPNQNAVTTNATSGPTEEEFRDIVGRLAPVVQGTCERLSIVENCSIRLYVADAPADNANAFQSVDRRGRPFVLVTRPLLAEIRNEDEIALVLAHEAAHHILNHLQRQRDDSSKGATVLAQAATRDGGSRREIREARRVGALVGARLFAQEYELQADALAALILRDAGFDPLRGAEFFKRIPDPGNHALNTHPSNAARLTVVRDAVLRNRLPKGTLDDAAPQT